MKHLIVFAIIIFSLSSKAQSLEEKLAATACQYLDSIPLSKLITPQDKKQIISFIFTKSVAYNQPAINEDKRFAGLTSYEQGKILGLLMAQKILPIMKTKCPNFKKIF